MKKEKQSYFITGTDTEIGKTFVTSTLLYLFAQQGEKVVGMKPIAAGATIENGEWVNEDVAALQAASNVKVAVDLMAPYVFPLAVAPHIAAKEAGRTIDIVQCVLCYQNLQSVAERVLVEGVGGFRVPLTDQEDTTDLTVHLGLPVIMVVGIRLGCISMALLTIEAILARGLSLAGWVANIIDPHMAHIEDNIAALAKRIPAPLLGKIPYLVRALPEDAAVYLDISLL